MSAIDYTPIGTHAGTHAGDGGNDGNGAAGGQQDPSRPRGLSGAHLSLIIVLTILSAVLWTGPDRVGAFASRMLQAYLDAQQTMLAATGNLAADGRAEFAVLLSDGASATDLRAAMAGMDDVSFSREADLSGWAIVSTTAGNREGLDALLELPQSRLLVPNRGLWICH
jgi:hypothetical protein